MKLSACMIVKNEEKVLERCLSSIRDHVDEIVIVDTGSTDGTIEIAQKYADILDEIEWPDDFSAARNHGINLATGDFIFIIDADERVPEGDSFVNIQSAMGVPDFIAAHVRVINTLEGDLIEGESVWQIRLFRNRPDIRYEFRAHNQIAPSIKRIQEKEHAIAVNVDAVIIHDGYDKRGKDAEAKYLDRIPLLRRQIEESKTDGTRAYFQYQLGCMLQVMGKIEEAAEVWKIVNYDDLDRFNAFYAHYVAAKAFRDIGHKAEGPARTWNYAMALKMANAMMGINSREPASYFIAGVLLLETMNDREGLMLLLEAMIRSYMKDMNRRFTLNKQGILDNIAIAYGSMGNEMAAEGVQALTPEMAYPVMVELQSEFIELDESIFE